VQNDQTAEEIRSDKRAADVEGQYRELKQLRKQLAIEQAKLLRQMPFSTKH
jgi:hypothetical protein